MLATGKGRKLHIAGLLMPVFYSALLLAVGVFGAILCAGRENGNMQSGSGTVAYDTSNEPHIPPGNDELSGGTYFNIFDWIYTSWILFIRCQERDAG